MGQERGWDAKLIESCKALLAETPPVPRGRLIFDPNSTERPVFEPGDDLVPASGFDHCEGTWMPWINAYRYCLQDSQHTELYSLWPAKLTATDPELKTASLRAYQNRHWPHHVFGWCLDVVFAANLGLKDEVANWFDFHFDHTNVFSCGLGQQSSPGEAGAGVPAYPGLQGFGTSVIPVIDQLIGDLPDGIRILPCWPTEVGVHFVLYNPLAGRVEVDYDPSLGAKVKTERAVKIEFAEGIRTAKV
jgi:hypothetical protein